MISHPYFVSKVLRSISLLSFFLPLHFAQESHAFVDLWSDHCFVNIYLESRSFFAEDYSFYRKRRLHVTALPLVLHGVYHLSVLVKGCQDLSFGGIQLRVDGCASIVSAIQSFRKWHFPRCSSHWAMMASMTPAVTSSRTRDIDVELYISSFLSPYEKHFSVENTSGLPPSVWMLTFFTPSIPMDAGSENLSFKFVGFVSSILPLFIHVKRKKPPFHFFFVKVTWWGREMLARVCEMVAKFFFLVFFF